MMPLILFLFKKKNGGGDEERERRKIVVDWSSSANVLGLINAIFFSSPDPEKRLRGRTECVKA